MLAYDYPLLGLFWTMLEIAIIIAWFFVLFECIIDVFRNKETGGFAKFLWLLFIIVLPLLGVLVYVLANGRGMSDRKMATAQAQDAAMRAYIQDAAAPTNSADQIAQLADLHAQGKLSDDEFAAGKAKILGS